MPPDLALLSTLTGSNYLCLELISMVPKVFEPLKFYCSRFCENISIFRVCRFFFIIYQRFCRAIRTETCLCGLVDRSTGSLTAVGLSLGWRTCEIAKRWAPSRL